MAVVRGIGGVTIYARDPTGLARWYADHLGMSSLIGEGSGQWSCDFYSRDSEDPELRRRTVWSVGPVTGHPPEEEGDFVVRYLVEDLDAALARLREDAIEVEGVQEHADGRFARLRDPEGHRIELWED